MSVVALPPAGPSAQKPSLTFEFTKRKRWADLLIAELADGIIFVLSPSHKVLFCGAAVTELLGWREVDLIDCDLVDLIAPDDQAAFRAGFEESVRTNTEHLSYVRLQCNDSAPAFSAGAKDVLFEIKGHLHSVSEHDTERRCFFAMAKPYPGRNMAMLNTFLELKMENERLQQRLAELKNCAPAQTLSGSSTVPLQTNSMYSTSSMPSQNLLSTMAMSSRHFSKPYYSNLNMAAGPYEEVIPSTAGNPFDSSAYNAGLLYTPPSTILPNAEDENEEGSKKKKLKKTHPTDQYVCITCGRTDSPEWRKGPLGPKTLCNACGLRWAKQMRKYDDPAGPSDDSQKAA